MYAALWRLLPGPTAVKVLQVVVLLGLAVAALFGWVFPWAEQRLPFLDVTVDGAEPAYGGSGVPASVDL